MKKKKPGRNLAELKASLKKQPVLQAKKPVQPKKSRMATPVRKKSEAEARFARLMNEVMGGRKAKPVTQKEIVEFEGLAVKERKSPLPEKLRSILTEALASAGKPSRQTLDDYVKIALEARSPRIEEKEDVHQLVNRMVARKIPGMPKLTPSAVEASLHLASALEDRKINFKEWVHGRMVV